MAPPLYSAKSKPYGSHRIRELYVFEVGHHQPPYVVGQGAGLVHNACVYLRLGYAVRDEDHGLRWGCCRCTSITCETRPADCMSAWPSGLEGPRLAGVGAAASTLCTRPLGLKYEYSVLFNTCPTAYLQQARVLHPASKSVSKIEMVTMETAKLTAAVIVQKYARGFLARLARLEEVVDTALDFVQGAPGVVVFDWDKTVYTLTLTLARQIAVLCRPRRRTLTLTLAARSPCCAGRGGVP